MKLTQAFVSANFWEKKYLDTNNIQYLGIFFFTRKISRYIFFQQKQVPVEINCNYSALRGVLIDNKIFVFVFVFILCTHYPDRWITTSVVTLYNTPIIWVSGLRLLQSYYTILYPELSFLLRYTTSLSTLILQDFCKIQKQ